MRREAVLAILFIVLLWATGLLLHLRDRGITVHHVIAPVKHWHELKIKWPWQRR